MAFDNIPIRDLMTKQVITLPPKGRIVDHASIFDDHKIHHAPVVDEKGIVLGMVSSKDVQNYYNITRIVNSGSDDPITIKDIMTSPIFSYYEDVSITSAAEAMLDNNLHAVVVVDKSDKLIGIITSTDLIRFVARGGIPSS